MMRVHISRTPKGNEAIQIVRSVFPQPGSYAVEPLAKADQSPREGDFAEWFLQRLFELVMQGVASGRDAIWIVLEEMLRRRGLEAPSQEDYWRLQQTLFDLTRASTARLVGFELPPDLIARLGTLGFRPPEALDFPALAYRIGLIHALLEQRRPATWDEVVRLAHARPLSALEAGTIEQIRTRAGQYLTPIFDEIGRVWTAEREIMPLRRLLEEGMRAARSPREMAQELANSQRARGILRDAERVVRTEIQEARSRAAWQQARDWKADDLVFRQPSRTPCRACLRLYLNRDGTPRLYRKRDVEAWSVTVNRGPVETWTPKIGSTHPNCVCSPWMLWHPAMSRLFAESAPHYRRLLGAL